MFLGPTGDTLFYKRRVGGLDVLFVFQPDAAGREVHARLSSAPGQIRAWPTQSGQVVVCEDWPRSKGGLRFRFYDARRIAALMERRPDRLNDALTDVPLLGDFTTEPKALPVALFERLRGERVALPGLASRGPAIYEIDGENASYRLAPLDFLESSALPGGLYDQPGGTRRWLTVGDSNHLFVLDAATHELEGDVIWPAEQRALARVAFHPTRAEAWVSAAESVFVYDRESLAPLAEIQAETELRWHQGERVTGFAGGVLFSRDGQSALIARPLSGDLLEVDVASRKRKGNIPLTIDPLEICPAPGVGRVYMQGLRNGTVSWMPWGRGG